MFSNKCILGFSLQFKGKKMPIAANGISGKGRTLSNSLKKSEFASNVKRSSSSEYSLFLLALKYFILLNYLKLRGKIILWA